jgi:predicted enzyme related to lactoylglutathione lyase
MPAEIANVSIDCDDVLKVASFWSAALGRALDSWSSGEFASIGVHDPERSRPAWFFNKVPEAKAAKNRVHLDIVSTDAGFVDELVGLGATVVGNHQISGHGWTVMQDPEGNEFCVAEKAFAPPARPTSAR